MKAKQALRALCAVTIAAFTSAVLITAPAAQAQNANPPSGLKWEWMHDVELDANPNLFTASASDQEQNLLSKIWAKEIKATGYMKNGSPYASFAVIGTIEHQDTKVILTMFNSYNSSCIQPGNGRAMEDIYATCPLRIIRFSANNQITEQNLPVNFCMIYGDDQHAPRAKNHAEYAFDERSGTVYLRIIQFGKIVPECNRAVRIFKI